MSLINANPRRARSLLRRSTDGRPSPPELVDSFPMKVRPRRAVPVVRMTAFAGMFPCVSVIMPVQRELFVSVDSPITASSITSMCRWLFITDCILLQYAALSHCARVACTAGPRLRFSVFSCRDVRSALKPISPPSASSSNTRWLFANPPMDGLQGIRAMASARPVTRRTGMPILAAMRAASAPAWPPPTTMMSGSRFIRDSIAKRGVFRRTRLFLNKGLSTVL